MWTFWTVTVTAVSAVTITLVIVTGSIIKSIAENKSYEHIENRKFNNGFLKEYMNRVDILENRVKNLENEFDV